MNQKNFKLYTKGMGIMVKIPGDIDKFGDQKIRPGIVIKSYPSHVKVQLLSTRPNKNDYYSVKIKNLTSYIRPIYCKTVPINEIKGFWYEKNERIIINSKSIFFKKVAEMEYKEISGLELNLEREIKFFEKEEDFELEFE